MKYTIAFCLLFILINSKEEFKPKFWTLKDLKGNNYDSNLEESVCEADTKDQCKALPGPNEDEICCYVENKYDGQTKNECSKFSKITEKSGDIYKMKEHKATLREIMGYQIYANGRKYPYKKVETQVTCKNGGYTTTFENSFSDEEKNILKDKRLCLYIEEHLLNNCFNFLFTNYLIYIVISNFLNEF